VDALIQWEWKGKSKFYVRCFYMMSVSIWDSEILFFRGHMSYTMSGTTVYVVWCLGQLVRHAKKESSKRHNQLLTQFGATSPTLGDNNQRKENHY
jgi:hypothetical protein